MTIHLQIATKNSSVPTKKQLHLWTEAALKKIKKNQSIGIRIVNKAESKKLNEYYRHKKGPTNVLSFPVAKMPGVESDYLGDLVICAPLVVKEAREQHKTVSAHWAHLVIHGVLHLLGYDHVKEKEAAIMEKLETDIMVKLGYPAPY